MSVRFRPLQYSDKLGNVLPLSSSDIGSIVSRAGTSYTRFRGESRPRTLITDAGWKIQKYTYDGTGVVVRIRTAVPADKYAADFDHIWDDSVAVSITGVTKANPGVVTAALHGYSSGDWIEITGCDMTELNGDGFGSKVFEVVKINDNSFSLLDADGAVVDSTGFVSVGTTGSAYARDYLNHDYV